METYSLKQQLAQTRQELSTALYQHDAAIRVIARLTRERDEARDALKNFDVNSAKTNGDAMQVDTQGLPAAMIEKVDATHQRLSRTRRKRPVPEDWAVADELQQFALTATSEPICRGGRSLAVDEGMALAGSSDGTAIVWSVSQQKIMQQWKCGASITDVAWVGDLAIISTSAGAVKAFENGTEVATFSSHAGPVNGIALHPGDEILASVGSDRSYCLYDLVGMKMVTQVFTDSGKGASSC